MTDLEHFTPEIIMTKNKAAAGLCSFVINIVMYYEVVVTVEPKRKALQEGAYSYCLTYHKLIA